jgi:hypothetical protein
VTSSIFLVDDRLAVRTSFHLKDLCKSILGARWDKDLKVWTYPATPHAARAVLECFPPERHVWSADAAKLLVEADAILRAAAEKAKDDLAPIPHTRTTPWKHQVRAFNFCSQLNAWMLALDMGCGKSFVVVMLVANKT